MKFGDCGYELGVELMIELLGVTDDEATVDTCQKGV